MKKYKLGDLLIEKNQGVNTTTEKVSYSKSGVPVLRAQNINKFKIDFSELTFVDEETFKRIRPQCKPIIGDVLYTNIGSQLGYSSVYSSNQKSMIAWNILKMRPNSELILPEYLTYCLNDVSFRNFIRNINSSSTMPFVSGATLESLEISIPELYIQKKIVDILEPLNQKIELNNQMNETLESMAKAIFKEWFIDFGPVKAKAEGKKPFGMDDETAALFPDSFEESDLGSSPTGWPLKCVSSLFEVNPKYSLKKNDSYPYTEMRDLPTNSMSVSGYIDRAFTSGSKFSNGDTLIARITPCLENGKTAFVDYLPEEKIGWGSTEFIVLRSKNEIPLEASYLLSRMDTFRSHLILNMSGSSGRQRVPEACLNKFYLTSPPKEIWVAFSRLVKPMFEKIRQNTQESTSLEKTRNFLLPKLISGEIHLNEAIID